MAEIAYALTTVSHFIDDEGLLVLAKSGSLYSIGVSVADGQIVQIELTERIAHLVWHFLSDTPAGKPCPECGPEVEK